MVQIKLNIFKSINVVHVFSILFFFSKLHTRKNLLFSLFRLMTAVLKSTKKKENQQHTTVQVLSVWPCMPCYRSELKKQQHTLISCVLFYKNSSDCCLTIPLSEISKVYRSVCTIHICILSICCILIFGPVLCIGRARRALICAIVFISNLLVFFFLFSNTGCSRTNDPSENPRKNPDQTNGKLFCSSSLRDNGIRQFEDSLGRRASTSCSWLLFIFFCGCVGLWGPKIATYYIFIYSFWALISFKNTHTSGETKTRRIAPA